MINQWVLDANLTKLCSYFNVHSNFLSIILAKGCLYVVFGLIMRHFCFVWMFNAYLLEKFVVSLDVCYSVLPNILLFSNLRSYN